MPALQSPSPSLAILAFNRLGFGPRPGDLDAFNQLGENDLERLDAYIEQQLQPDDIDDAECDQYIANAGLESLAKSRQQMWRDYVRDRNDQTRPNRPLIELTLLTAIRAIYSKRQLAEILADFWHNHFNVYAPQNLTESMIMRYDRDVIRAHMLGNFREMLEEVAKSSCMLYYLDNYTSSNAGPNENWARELFELHTMGEENYLGSAIRQADVEGFPDQPVGYVDDDIYEATRCFTGWSIRGDQYDDLVGDTGDFFFREEWHDRFQKTVLGSFLPADQPETQDGINVLDLLSDHPGTARHICRKLCRRLVGEETPEALVGSAAELFHAERAAPDQLKQVVGHILRSEAFRGSWGSKVKRPFEAAVSAIRALDINLPLNIELDTSRQFFYIYEEMGQPLFSWPAPDGYPDRNDYWLNTTSIFLRWRLFNWFVERRDDAGNHYFDLFGQMPAASYNAEQAVDFWIGRLFGRSIPSAERGDLVEFLAQGHNPSYQLPLRQDENTAERLRSMVALALMSPPFQWK